MDPKKKTGSIQGSIRTESKTGTTDECELVRTAVRPCMTFELRAVAPARPRSSYCTRKAFRCASPPCDVFHDCFTSLGWNASLRHKVPMNCGPWLLFPHPSPCPCDRVLPPLFTFNMPSSKGPSQPSPTLRTRHVPRWRFVVSC